jgi:hypothetical protein
MQRKFEHRWGKRFVSDVPIELRTTDGTCSTALVRNVSLSGVLIETSRTLDLMSQVAVRPVQPTAHWQRAFVIRLGEEGMGLEWFEPGIDTVAPFLSPNCLHALSMHEFDTQLRPVLRVGDR